MKKLVLVFAMIFATMTFAQTNLSKADVATSKGTYFLGVNASNVGFENLDSSQKKLKKYNVGANFGGFVADRLALVASVGYGSEHREEEVDVNKWTYLAGVKYYVMGVVPVQVDYNRLELNRSENPDLKRSFGYVGTKVGYALFPFDNFSIEPNLKYNWSTEKHIYPNVFSGGLNFNLFF